LLALADPKYVLSGITNKMLQERLRSSSWAKNGTAKQLAARISRNLRLLRDHGLIRKMPNQRKYILTEKGRTLTTALNALLAASIQTLMEKAA
jgi:DNA-binding HxlR family transcriptional regulator